MARTLLVGAEVRVDPEAPDPCWDDARRESYLLRRDVGRPLSIDRTVWPSCPMADGQRSPDALPWVSIEEVRQRAVEARTTHQLRVVTIVLGLVIENANDEALAASQGIENQMIVEPGWQLLGFDIADGALSGLSNCGYKADEATGLRDAWAGRLNGHGLFDEVHDALAFRTVTEARVREHAPFAVYAMWLVEDTL
jgi:hypothetical protein